MVDHSQRQWVKELCRTLRKQSTKSEQLFWVAVRDRRFENKKFYRQKPIYFEYHGQERFFIADFYCHEEKLVIEIDGKIHEFQKDYDRMRTFIINELGMRVIRFKNKEIKYNLPEVLGRLKSELQISPSLPKRRGQGTSSKRKEH